MATPQSARQPWPPEKRGASVTSVPPRADADENAPDADPLLVFRSENTIRQDAPARPSPTKAAATAVARSRPRWSTAGIVTLLVIGAAAVAAGVVSSQFVQARRLPTPAPTVAAFAVAEGTVTVNSRPEGAQVSVDNIPRGVTPLKLTLPAGEHSLELQNGAATRTVPLPVQAGVVLSQYLDLAPVAAPAPSVGRLEVSSDPVGARVTVDGVARGVTPATLSNVTPGVHNVSIVGADATVTRSVTVAAGSTASVVVSLTPAGAAAGWAQFRAPFELQVLEGGRVVGTTSADRLMLPAGRHDFVLSNAALEFDVPMTVQVAIGKVASQVVPIPNGSLSINATPWADVILDGQAIGTTPLANLSVPVGTHEIIFRNPQLGERRQSVVVKAKSPARVGVSFR